MPAVERRVVQRQAEWHTPPREHHRKPWTDWPRASPDVEKGLVVARCWKPMQRFGDQPLDRSSFGARSVLAHLAHQLADPKRRADGQQCHRQQGRAMNLRGTIRTAVPFHSSGVLE
jgi:hypothetical protein